MGYSGIKSDTLPCKPVYDIINCGPRQRFVVQGAVAPFIVHNCVQALARIVVAQQMLWINLQHRVVLTVHDAAMCVVPEEDLTNALEYITLCMSTTPEWAAGLPIACEAKQGTSYGNCK